MATLSIIGGEEFKPVTLELVLESQHELDSLGSIFNCSQFADIFGSEASDHIVDTLAEAGANIHQKVREISSSFNNSEQLTVKAALDELVGE